MVLGYLACFWSLSLCLKIKIGRRLKENSNLLTLYQGRNMELNKLLSSSVDQSKEHKRRAEWLRKSCLKITFSLFSIKMFKFKILLYLIPIILTFASTNNCANAETIKLTKVLPKIWSSLSWNKVDLIRLDNIPISDYQTLMKESSRENINLRQTIWKNNKYSSVAKDSKLTLILSSVDDHQFLTKFMKSVKPFSTLVAFTITNFTQNFLKIMQDLDWTHSFYLLETERQVLILWSDYVCVTIEIRLAFNSKVFFQLAQTVYTKESKQFILNGELVTLEK